MRGVQVAETVEALAALKSVLAYDSATGAFTWLERVARRTFAGDKAGCKSTTGYWQLRFKRAEFKAHRVAWAFVYGAWPTGCIDHINGNPLDNSIANLRDVDQRTNNQNQRRAMRSNKSSGLLGVSVFRGKPRATITLNGKNLYLGTFDTPQQAHEAYLAAKRAIHPGCTL